MPGWQQRGAMFTPELIFDVGGRIPIRAARTIARIAGSVAGRLSIAGIERWRANVALVTGSRPTSAQTRRMIRHWVMNNLWSMSLGRWDDHDVLARVTITDEHVARMRASLDGPGLILALPHMGSWDFAGAWCARVGVRVVSVAERLPGGLFERFRDARAAMGMKIYPSDEPDLMRKLAADIAEGSMVCLLADRDISGTGVDVTWPTGSTSTMPAGPALLARRTGADMRVTTTHFEGDAVRLTVSEPLDTVGGTAAVTQRMAVRFAEAIAADPDNWLVLQPLVR